MKKERMLIGGRWVESEKGDYLEVINPATEEVFAQVSCACSDDVEEAVEEAEKAFFTWSKLSPAERAEYLNKASKLILERSGEIAKTLTSEQGKPLKEAEGEVKGSAEVIHYFAEEALRLYGDFIPNKEANIKSLVIRQPIGVVAAITPWNYPVQLLAWKVGAALAAGCTVVAKPSSQTPLSPLKFLGCFVDAGLPAGVVNGIVGAGKSVGDALIRHRKVKKVAFTGSTEAGKKVMNACSEGLKKVSLELGGQSPMIVFADCNLEQAVKGAVRRSFRNMGQVCNAINRIYVERKIYDEFMEKFVKTTEKLVIDNGLENPSADLGPMVSREALDKVLEHIEDAVKKGARIVCGGKKPEGEKYKKGFFFKPTIIVDVNHEMLIMQEETFGPAVGVMAFEKVDEVIRLANDTRYGLAAYVYTNNIHLIRRVCEELECGSIGVNNVNVATTNVPYGGWKESGLGTELGREGLEEYTQIKHIKLEFFDIY
ncbi:NAD-dependent succinate-semialdehyde dehydrogenase [Candidatus Aerophobetes bacterium]|nr:NAD-dependent succinate-semialdehyde dehydrogenase [Candidatus Aerophobetes bacterium]